MDSLLLEAKQVFDSSGGGTDATALRDIFSKYMEILMVAGGSVQERTTVLLMQVSQLRVSPQYAPIAIFLLHAQLTNVPEVAINTFVKECISHLSCLDATNFRPVLSEVIAISQNVTEFLCAKGNPRCLLRTLRHLIVVTQPSEICLTPIHADYLQACIAGQMYRMAYDFVKNSIVLEVDPARTGLSSADPSKYFYYAGK